MAKRKALDDLFKRAENISTEATLLRAEAKDLREKAGDADTNAQERAKAGDLDGYMKLKAQKELLEAKAYVSEKHAEERLTSISMEDVISAWESYQKEYAIEFKSTYEAFKRTRSEMIRLFLELLKMQNEALRLREKTGKLAGIVPSPLEDVDTTFHRLPMPMMEKCAGRLRPPEADCVEQYTGLKDKPPAECLSFRAYVGGIIQQHRPQDPFKHE